MLPKIGPLILAVFTIAGASAAVLVVPEFREYFGLDAVNDMSPPEEVTTPPAELSPSYTKFDEVTEKGNNTLGEHNNDCKKYNPPISCLWR